MALSDDEQRILRQIEQFRQLVNEQFRQQRREGAERGDAEPVKRGDTCTRDQAWAWLAEDVGVIRDDVIGAIAWEAPEHIVDACTCFAYNIGFPAFVGSTALKRLNAGDRAGAATALKWWNKATSPKTGQKRVLGDERADFRVFAQTAQTQGTTSGQTAPATGP